MISFSLYQFSSLVFSSGGFKGLRKREEQTSRINSPTSHPHRGFPISQTHDMKQIPGFTHPIRHARFITPIIPQHTLR
jgi:hypothetical protein